MVEIMRGFPIIEDFVTVLDGGKEGREDGGGKEDVECDHWL
jgi:hypothetical protein